MTLCTDISAASWIVQDEQPWQQLVTLGPAGLPAYARLRFLPDPTHPHQDENDALPRPGAGSETEQLRTVVNTLARSTGTPGRCHFLLWDGWGLHPGEHGPGSGAPLVRIPHRGYHLFTGAASDLGDWGPDLPLPPHGPAPDPAFVWPADRAWCVTRDVDPHYAGIGAAREAIAELLRNTDLDVVPADPALPQPAYR